ncbi:WD40 repeat domain-containing protein [Phototrophicus methaneseepsis]|uniref:WD40 repeat domain-containing protein n=1 Tax=Phototrophicus methaneseepsis TaxID=2710758 RepID=A0A7S8EB80_9CHLR|nr:WD40 repeat domain-containing protein [Phototrophicus methaneseepsis]QPC83750.1 WD40 repeat domain-containing protein [Phototrophicus methaneseepsis]
MLDVATKAILYRVSNRNIFSLKYATFHPNGQLFATTGDRSALAYIWDAQTGELHREMSRRLGDFIHLAYSPDGKLIAAIERSVAINPGDIKYNLDVQDSNTDEETFDTLDYRPIKVSAFSQVNRYFVVNSRGEIRVYSTISWEVICSLK